MAVRTSEADSDERGAGEALGQALARHRDAFPDVHVSIVDRPGHPLAVLLDEVGPSQLIVTGRHSDRRRGGFPFGSVAHGVLHYAEVPVALSPCARGVSSGSSSTCIAARPVRMLRAAISSSRTTHVGLAHSSGLLD